MDNLTEKQEEQSEEIATWRTIAKWGVILIVVVSFFANIYYFGWKKLESSIYQKGYDTGFAESQNKDTQMIVQNLCQRGELGVNLPKNCDLTSNETMPVILIPKIQNNVTTSK
jgi:magnesium-transporting ATPase (P-type)